MAIRLFVLPVIISARTHCLGKHESSNDLSCSPPYIEHKTSDGGCSWTFTSACYDCCLPPPPPPPAQIAQADCDGAHQSVLRDCPKEFVQEMSDWGCSWTFSKPCLECCAPSPPPPPPSPPSALNACLHRHRRPSMEKDGDVVPEGACSVCKKEYTHIGPHPNPDATDCVCSKKDEINKANKDGKEGEALAIMFACQFAGSLLDNPTPASTGHSLVPLVAIVAVFGVVALGVVATRFARNRGATLM